MSDITSVGAVDAAVGATGSAGVQGSIAISVLAGTEQMMPQTASILLASLGLGQSVSTEA